MTTLVFAASYATMRVIWLLLGLAGCLGVLALVSPQLFSRISVAGSRWVDTSKVVERLDTRIDVDHYILPYSRVLGALVIASVVVLGMLIVRR